MKSWFEHLLNISPIAIYSIVAGLVFAEDAIFVGFVIPGETAAVISGVYASHHHGDLPIAMIVVVLAAVIGDSVGFEVGKHLGPRLLNVKPLHRHRHRLEEAQDLLARRGGGAVFLGRFVAFFRAMMPALAGASGMKYRKFILWNWIGGLVWGIGFVLLGYLAGNSYEAVAKRAGQASAGVVAAIVIIGLIIWRIRSHRAEAEEEEEIDLTASDSSSP